MSEEITTKFLTRTGLEERFDRTFEFGSRMLVFWYFIVFACVAFFIRPSTDLVVLRYNAFFGVDILGAWWQAYLIPGMSFLFLIGNLGLAFSLRRRGAIVPALILLFGALLVALAGTIATAAVIFINT